MADTTLRFATLNLQNLQLPGEALYPKTARYSVADYEAKVAWLGGVVKRLDADVLGVQELWTPRCLYDVFASADLDQAYKLVTTMPVDAVGSAISVGLAVRKNLASGTPEWIEDFPSELVLKKRKAVPPTPDYEMSVDIDHFSRPVLRCRVTAAFGDPIDVFVVHLKSKLPMELDAP